MMTNSEQISRQTARRHDSLGAKILFFVTLGLVAISLGCMDLPATDVVVHVQLITIAVAVFPGILDCCLFASMDAVDDQRPGKFYRSVPRGLAYMLADVLQAGIVFWLDTCGTYTGLLRFMMAFVTSVSIVAVLALFTVGSTWIGGFYRIKKGSLKDGKKAAE